MSHNSFQLYDDKAILRVRGKICETPEELLSSDLFRQVLKSYLHDLSRRKSSLLSVFPESLVTEDQVAHLIDTFQLLVKLPGNMVVKVLESSHPFLRDRSLLNDFVEQLYNYWRRLHRAIICDAIDDRFDLRPYRTFNDTVEKMMHVVRSTYRDIQENITGNHPRVFRQVSAGAEVAAISLPMELKFQAPMYEKLNAISVIRQIMIYPPMIFNSPTNTRKGMFEQVDLNPLDGLQINPQDWLCYPARVGPLVVLIYFSMRFFELGFSLCNLFELASDRDLRRKPDAIYMFGVPQIPGHVPGACETVFYDDQANNLLVAAIPQKDEFGYFGYLKKMTLTLHNILMMKQERMPYHGAYVHISLRGKGSSNVLVLGDSGAGKSETLEALRQIAGDDVEDLTIIADDMGSLGLDDQGCVVGYGTEMGAFVRLDDLQSGYALGQIDRTIIMNPDQVNARVVIPVTKYEDVIKGYPVDVVLYANNYEEIDAEHPVIQRFDSPTSALEVFRAGAVMSKGTTNTSGLVHTYFANIFGPPQFRDLHDRLAQKYFEAFFQKSVFVGEIRTRLGIKGMERQGPIESAKALLEILGQQA